MKINRRGRKDIIVIDADTWDEYMMAQPILLDEEEERRGKQKVLTVLDPSKIQPEGTHPDWNNYYSLKVDTLEITSQPPLTVETFHLMPCEEKKETEVKEDDIYLKNYGEIKECPFFKAMNKDGEMSLMRDEKTGETYVKYEREDRIIYFTESFLKKQLLKHRGIDIDQQRIEEGEKADKAVMKIEDGHQGKITNEEKAALTDYLKDKPNVSFSGLNGKVQLYKTPFGNMYHIEGSTFKEQWALYRTNGEIPQIEMKDGSYKDLKQVLEKGFGRNLDGGMINHSREDPKDDVKVLADWYIDKRKQERKREEPPMIEL